MHGPQNVKKNSNLSTGIFFVCKLHPLFSIVSGGMCEKFQGKHSVFLHCSQWPLHMTSILSHATSRGVTTFVYYC